MGCQPDQPLLILDQYPALRESIDLLCDGKTWGIVGASAILRDEEAYYFEITKPKFWATSEDGRAIVGIGGIGGHVETGEGEIECVLREAKEELGVEVQVLPSPKTHLVFEEAWAKTLRIETVTLPVPYFLTIGPKETKHSANLPYEYLAIVTFEAVLHGQPHPRDLYGMLRIEAAAIADILGPETISLCAVRNHPGVRVQMNGVPPQDALLRPVFTARSFQIILRES